MTARAACALAVGLVAFGAALTSPAGAGDTCAGDGIVLGDADTQDAYGVARNDHGLYVVGTGTTPKNGEWRVEKRDLDTCGVDAGFGIDGAVHSNPTVNWDVPRALAADADALYVVGGDGAFGTGYDRWRIEKRAASDGSLVAAFGAGGVVTGGASVGTARALALGATSIYVAGSQSFAWYVEKRDKASGALDAGFGSGGAVTSSGEAYAIASAGNDLVVAGSSDFVSWRMERRDAADGGLVYDVVTTFPDVGCGPQAAFAAAVGGGFAYLAGEAAGRWRVEKRDVATGSLVWAHDLSHSGSCDAAQGAVLADGFLYVVGEYEHRWRIEKRSLETGALAVEFGVEGVVTADVQYSGAQAAVADADTLYTVGYQTVAGAIRQWRIEKRRLVDGSLISETRECTPLTLSDCRTTVRLVEAATPRDHLSLRCLLTLGTGSNGIDPGAEGVRVSLTTGSAPACTPPCFAADVMPTRRGRCWRYRAKASVDPSVAALSVCEIDAARGTYRLRVRSQRTDLHCLAAGAPNATHLTIGDDCSGDCSVATPRPTTTPRPTATPTPTSTPPPTGCTTVSRAPAAVANVAPLTNDWLWPEYALVEDGATTLVRLFRNAGTPSSYLAASGFGFAVPATAEITGITVTVVRAARDPGSISDAALRIVKGGAVGASDRSQPGLWDPFYTAVDYGGPSDLWDTAWTAAEVNDPGFGAAIRAEYLDTAGNNDAAVDAIRIAVHYCQ